MDLFSINQRWGKKLWRTMNYKGIECPSNSNDCTWWYDWRGAFHGATSTIKWTGPSVILAYLIAGIFLFLIMRAMGK